MDSLTQIALGAAVGEAVLGRKVGNRAALWGGICGTLPDLDVFISMGGAVADFTYHRSFTHSLLVLALISPLIAGLIMKLHPQTASHRKGWLCLVLAVLLTHPLLDSFTVYGTQLFWPLDDTPIGLGSIFIIDPLYTLPLLLGVTGALIGRRHLRRGRQLNAAGLLLSSLYLLWSVAAQGYVTRVAEENLAHQDDYRGPLLVTPAPGNTLLWRVVAMGDQSYREGYYSLLDRGRRIHFYDYPSETALLATLEEHWPVQRLQWFTRGFYKVQDLNGDVVMSDLRMGAEPAHVFRFKVAEASNPHPTPVPDERLFTPHNFTQLPAQLERIWVQPQAPGE